MEKGLFVRAMEKLFGQSWKTSFFGLLAFLSEAANIIQQYLVQMDIPDGILHTVAAIFALIAIMRAKDANVVGRSDVPAPPAVPASLKTEPGELPAKPV